MLPRQLHKTFLYRIDVFDVWCKSDGIVAVKENSSFHERASEGDWSIMSLDCFPRLTSP